MDDHSPPRLRLPRVRMTTNAFERMRGLLGRALAEDEGLMIAPCNSIHTWFMGFAIDAVFLDRHNRVIKVVHGMKPFRLAMAFGSSAVLEVKAGVAGQAGIQPGDTLVWVAKE